MSERLFDTDPAAGITEYFSYDETNDTFTIRTEQDVGDILEVNKALANDAPYHWRGDLHRVASLPLTVLMQLAQKGIMTPGGRILDQKKLKDFLNDPENRFLRTREGRL